MKRLLGLLATIGLAVACMGQVRLRTIPIVGGSQSLIAWSDFTYQGSYSVPSLTTFSGGDTKSTTTFTGRYVSGTLQFIAATSDNAPDKGEVGLYEFDLNGQAPGMGATAASLPSARMLQDYGTTANHDGTTNLLYKQGEGTSGSPEPACTGGTTFFGNSAIKSLRAIGNRLYWGYGNDYPPSGCNYDGGLGFSTLGTYPAPPSNPHSYILNSIGYKAGWRGFVEVPSSWSNGTYPNLTGMTVAQANGGYESIITTGGTSLGPTMIPFVPGNGTESQRATLSNYPLMLFTGGACSPRSFKPVVSPAYINDAIDPCSSSVFGWMDAIRGVEWINTTRRKGILHFVELSTGTAGYFGATVVAEGYVNKLLITNPDSLIPVATGSVTAGSVDWGTNTDIQWPFYDYTTPCGGFTACSATAVTSIVTSGPTATVTVADTSLIPGHPLLTIAGANESEFNTRYNVPLVIDSTHFRICAGVNGGTFDQTTLVCNGANWTNASATGTITYKPMNASGFPKPFGPIAMWFDPTDNTLWVLFVANQAKPVLGKYTCAAC